MAKVALAGGAYQAHSVIASAQRSVNLFGESMPEAQGEPMPAAHYPTPGLVLLATIGTGPIRGIRQCTTGGVYVVSGSTLYSVDPANRDYQEFLEWKAKGNEPDPAPEPHIPPPP